MEKISIVLAIFLIAFPKITFSQDFSVPDSITINQAMVFLLKKNAEMEKMLRDSIQVAYSKDSTQFLEKNGEISKFKISNYILEILSPLKRELLNNTVKKILSKREYDYFSNLKFRTYMASSGIAVSTLDNTISYDTKWISNFYIKSSLVFSQDFSYDEWFYYLTSYEITGNPNPEYIENIISNNGFLSSGLNSIVNSSFDFFILMHEFYHAYYEQRLSLINNEIAADSFALKKWEEYTYSQTNQQYITDSDLNTMGSLLFTKEYMSSFSARLKDCNATRLVNKRVTLNDVSQSFLGIAFFQILLTNDIRTLLTNTDVVQQDISRINKFVENGLQMLKCGANDSSVTCCSMNTLKNNYKDLNDLIERFKDFDPYSQKVDTNAYKKIFPQNPSLVPFFLGNFYLKIKNFKAAINFYKSANMLSKKTDLSVLCNLFCYEIYKNVEAEHNLNEANKYLIMSKQLNALTPTIRESIINSLN